jgi:hypothetical protein
MTKIILFVIGGRLSSVSYLTIMGSRWVSLACFIIKSIWARMSEQYCRKILLFFFINCRYRVAEVEWLQDIPLPEGSQERREVKSSHLFMFLNSDNSYLHMHQIFLCTSSYL